MVFGRIRKRWHFLLKPQYKPGNRKGAFEDALSEYLILLIVMSVLTGAAVFAANTLKSLYYGIFFDAGINYWNMLNYSFGLASGAVFFCFFAGTFLVFLASIALRPLVRAKYVQLLEMMFMALSPVLLFAWVPGLWPALLLWSGVIFVGILKQGGK